MRLAGRRRRARPRDRQEANPEGLHETDRGETTGQREHANRQRRADGDFGLRDLRSGEQRLKHHPFRREAVERRQRGRRHRSH